MIKMIALDLDGTLLNTKDEITNETKDILFYLSKQGIKITICTGRMYKDALIHVKMLGLKKADIVAFNGAVVALEDGTFLRDKIINGKTAYEILSGFKDLGIDFHAYGKDTIYSPKLNYSALMYYSRNIKYGKKRHINVILKHNLINNIHKNKIELNKLMCVDKTGKLLKKALGIIGGYDGVENTASTDINAAVMCKGSNKGAGIKTLCEYYKIKPDEVMAFGDSYNDLSMMKYVGHPIAMENARDEIKKASMEVTRSNNDDGIAYALKKHFKRIKSV